MPRAQILVIAVLMKAVMQRTFNVFQWEALVLLVAGITVNQLNYCTCVCPQNSHSLWLVLEILIRAEGHSSKCLLSRIQAPAPNLSVPAYKFSHSFGVKLLLALWHRGAPRSRRV